MSRLAAGIAVGLLIGLVAGSFAASTLLTSRSFAPIEQYDVLPDDRTLVVRVGLGRLDPIGYVAADEDMSRVQLRVLVIHHPGTATSDLLLVDVRTFLAEPVPYEDGHRP